MINLSYKSNARRLKKLKILAIGNSFSQDATRYLKGIADADSYPMKVVNLYIGGCSLERHYNNMIADAKEYSYELSGKATGNMVSIKDALTEDVWDIVTLQQVSSKSFDFNTYEPYLSALAAYVREFAPKAKLYIHQTWAYEDGSDKLYNVAGFNTSRAMLEGIERSYGIAREKISAYGIIPSGKLFGDLLDAGIQKVHRDTFHASLGLGRYALGLLWYERLTGNDISGNAFSDFDEEISEKNISIVKNCVHNLRDYK